jgi:hypothetical protein
MRWYVGYAVEEPRRYVAFKSDTTPTQATHGHLYGHVIGPFKTKRGADFMARYGAGNPHCTTVEAIERIAKLATSAS